MNDKASTVILALIDINPIDLKYCPFTIKLDKCTGNCNALSAKTCVLKKKKVMNFKAFSMITNKYDAKKMTEHISCNCKCKLNGTTCNSKQK